jgi:hypothetical protein
MNTKRSLMSENSIPGACFCGEIEFSIELPTLFCGHCHCTMCRRNHGAGYVTWFGVPRKKLSIDAGAASLKTFDSSDHGRRSFCGRCGSSLFCELSEHPDQIDVVLANMNEEIDRSPQFHSFFDRRVDWIPVDDELPKLGGPTGMEPLENGS